MQVNILEAKNRLSDLIRCAERGEEVVIANRGRGVVRLVRLEEEPQAAPPAEPGDPTALLVWLDQHAGPFASSGRRSTQATEAQRHEVIQARIEATRNAWD